MNYIRSSKHTTKYTNNKKSFLLNSFINEYKRIAQIYLDYLWNNKIEWFIKNKSYILDIKNNKFDVPRFLDKSINKNIQTSLSARALKCCSTQVLGLIKAEIKKQSKRLYIVKKLLAEKRQPSRTLLNKIRQNKPIKPNIENLKPELNSICCDLKECENGEFNYFLQLKSVGKRFGKIRIPIKNHRQSDRLKNKGKMLPSFLISSDYINIRYEIISNKKKSDGIILGADQGYKDVLTLSNGVKTPKQDNHKHSLESIIAKLAKKKKNSKAFHEAQEHRKNFINWSINQLNFHNVKQINLEKIWNIGYKTKSSRKMSHWTNTLIRDKLLKSCEEQEVLVKLQPSHYMSQRCSNCGLVRKSNRKEKQYICKGCGSKMDADLNAARNHEQNLKYLSWELRKFIKEARKNLGNGFYWNSSGFFNVTGEDLTVSLSKNKPLE